MVRRMFVLVLGLGLAAVMATAAMAQVTITFRYGFPDGDVIRDALVDFEKKNPGIKVNLQRSSFTEARDQLVREAAVGGGPDVAHLAFDNCFEGWRGPARIRDEKLSLRLSSSLPYLVVFTPATKEYYCVEPVSHVSNAIHMSDPAAHGLRALAPQATFDAWMKLEIGAA